MSIGVRAPYLGVHIPPAAVSATSYANPGGTGDRRLLIYFSATGISGLNDVLVDGVIANQLSGSGAASGAALTYDFGDRYIVDEAKWYQSDSSTHGSWKWQGSNDGSSWADIGAAFTFGGAAVQTQTALNGNAIYYRWYRLAGVSGSFNGAPSIQEIEFKISAPLVPLPATFWTSGDKRGSITISKSAGFSVSGALDGILDGSYGASWFSASAVSGQWLQFDFAIARVVNRAVWYETNNTLHGVWKWQASADASSWTDIGFSFTFPVPQMHPYPGSIWRGLMQDLAQNRTAYRYYRLLGVSGTFSGLPNMIEVEFISDVPAEFAPHNKTSNTTPGPSVISSSSFFSGGGEPWRAFDGAWAVFNNYWLGQSGGVDYLQIDLGSGNSKILTSYAIRVNGVPEPNRAPKNWTMQGSNNATAWDTLDTVANQTAWGNAEQRTFACDVATVAYRYFRLSITANNGDATYTQVAELYLFA